MLVKIFHQILQNLKSTHGTNYKEGSPTAKLRAPSYQGKYSLQFREAVRL
jgi:hypothetical protein